MSLFGFISVVSVELYSDWIGLLRELFVDRIITKKQNLE